LQDPRTILIFLLLLTAITLNLLRVFELLAIATSFAATFGVGALAALVATSVGHFLVRRWERRSLPPAGSVACSQRSVWGLPFRSWRSLSFLPCGENCPGRDRGW
jgi:hypothetical protein